MSDAYISLNLNTEAAKLKARRAIFQAVEETFELDIKAAAKNDSPVLTGTNRRSIDTEVDQRPEGVHAEMYTQSGYGGYLETGTRRMKAQPYLWPAFERFVKKIPARVRSLLHG